GWCCRQTTSCMTFSSIETGKFPAVSLAACGHPPHTVTEPLTERAHSNDHPLSVQLPLHVLYLRAQCSCGSLSTGRRYYGSPVHENDPSVQMEGCGSLEVFKLLFILSMAVHMAMKETRWSRSTISRLGPSIVMAPRAACGRATGWSPLRPTPLL